MDAATWTQEEIKHRANAKAEAERAQFQGNPEPEEQGDGNNGHDKEWTGTPTDQEEPAPIPPAFVLDCLRSNEDGDAKLFVELHRGRFKYDHAVGVWYKWAGNYWTEDLLNEVMAGIEKVISVYGQAAQRQAWLRLQAEKSGNQDKAKTHRETEDGLIKRVRALQSLNRKKNVLELARIGADGLGITGEEWDRDPWLLGCLNGVLELQTATHRPGKPEDFIKTVAPVEWKGPDEPAPTWEKFQFEVADGDRDLIRFKQRFYGYCLTGETTHHFAPILEGAGRNGKGTEIETQRGVLGPYAGAIEAELILKQRYVKHSGGPASDIMNLRGKRLVWVSETDEGRRLNAGKLKWLCGGDTLTGRGVYGKRQIDFRPTHKLLILTNHLPKVDETDYALWARLHRIPFKICFVDEPTAPNERKADPELLAKLRAEGSGILAWLVRGCLDFQREGLKPPETVRAATREYREAEDILSQFIEERFIKGETLQVKGGDCYKAYREWADEMGLSPITGTKFGTEMKRRFPYYTKIHVFYVGLGLRDLEG
jgi:putative DNA primase/helicase